MPGGAYSALSGMQTRLEELDRLAADLANIGTAGYKREQTGSFVAERTPFARELESAVDVVAGNRRVDHRPGTLASTGRNLDLAIEGKGYFVIDTPNGARYTRDGGFTRKSDGTLVTREGEPVLGTNGPIRIPAGDLRIEGDGTVKAGATVAGRIRVVEFASEGDLVRESGARFRAIPGAAEPTPARQATVLSGSLEQSNASVVDIMARLTDLTRTFETLQRGVSVLSTDLDGRAITELAKR